MGNLPSNQAPYRLIDRVDFGDGVTVGSFTNLYGCTIGAHTRIGPFVEVQSGVTVGDWCKIQSHSFLCTGVTIGDRVFVSHGVMFINDRRPVATRPGGGFQHEDDWELLYTRVGNGASIGTGAVILGGLDIGPDALIGAGAVVTRTVPAGAVVSGSPARSRHSRASNTSRSSGQGV